MLNGASMFFIVVIFTYFQRFILCFITLNLEHYYGTVGVSNIIIDVIGTAFNGVCFNHGDKWSFWGANRYYKFSFLLCQ